MRMLLLSLTAAGLVTLTACGGSAPAGGDAASGAKADAGGDPEEIICCEFGGAKGTSTRSKCLESEGKVHPRSDCP